MRSRASADAPPDSWFRMICWSESRLFAVEERAVWTLIERGYAAGAVRLVVAHAGTCPIANPETVAADRRPAGSGREDTR
jgi:hypothetical protein